MSVETNTVPPRYRDATLIGRGGMGEIYRARDETLGREVAIKMLAERYASDEAVRRRFTREALTAARLSGEPAVVTIFDVGEWNGRPFIVMEYLERGSLDQVLRSRGPQPPEQALGWLEQAAEAIDTAHARGVVHRDVKPGNLLLDRNGDVHVADFGIASAAGLDSVTMTGTVLGTAGYLAPEQALGERATPATDRYAFAVVAWELLTGVRPFENDSATAEALGHVQGPVPRISERNPMLPRELDPVLERALAKDPAARYPTCADFVAALRQAFLDAADTTSERVPARAAPLPMFRERRRSRTLPVVVASLFLAGLAGVTTAAVLADGDNEQAAPNPGNERTVTVTGPGTTTERVVTETTPPPPPAATPPPPSPPAATTPTATPPPATTPTATPPPAPPPASPPATSGASGATLNNRGYAMMQAGDYQGALPLLEQAVRKLSGTRQVDEAYALYNLAYTRLQLGDCRGVVAMLDRSERIQGQRSEIDRARARATRQCA